MQHHYHHTLKLLRCPGGLPWSLGSDMSVSVGPILVASAPSVTEQEKG
jgi:hypothetical protein